MQSERARIVDDPDESDGRHFLPQLDALQDRLDSLAPYLDALDDYL